MSLGERVKSLRRKKGWTQQDLADQIDRKQNTISYIENGGGAEIDTLKALADVFNVTPDYLVQDDIAGINNQTEYDNIDFSSDNAYKSNNEEIKKSNEYEFVFNIVKSALDDIINPEELDDEKMAYFKALFKQAIENKTKKNSTND